MPGLRWPSLSADKNDVPLSSDVSLPAGFIRALGAASTQEQMLRVTADWLPKMIVAERASIALPMSPHHMELYAFGGTAEVVRADAEMPIATSMVGEAYRKRSMVLVEDMAESHFDELPALVKAGLRSAVAAPMVSGDRCLGTVNVANSQPGSFSSVDHELVQTVADLIAGSLSLVQAAEQEKIRAMTDDLTGALNRGAVLAELNKRFDDEDDQPSLLFLDLDGFKLINDIHGHNVGDQVLRILVSRIRSRLADGDLLGRLGGDEFLVVLRDDGNGCRAEELAGEISTACGTAVVIRSLKIDLSLSIGVASPSSGVESATDMLADADRAMYRAKRSDRSLVVADDEIRRQTAMLTVVDRDLDIAMADQSIVFHYQPVRELATGRITGVEALIRWQHPQYQAIPPPLLIDRIEATGRVASFTRWCLDVVARDMTAIRGAVPSFSGGRIGVNLSPLQLAMSDCADMHASACLHYGLDPADILVEVVESSAINPGDEAERTLHKLADNGAQIGLDDFGTGHNALGYFTQFPIHMMKFDRSLVGVLTTNSDAYTILKVLASMCQELGIAAVAEGIEQEEEMVACRQFGIDYGQGWHLGRPKPLANLIELLQEESEGLLLADSVTAPAVS